MTASELVIYVCIYRSNDPLLLDEGRKEVSLGIEQMVAPADLGLCVDHMLHRWLRRAGDRLRERDEGRILARPLSNGLIRMLDQSACLLDVALMLSVFRLPHDQLGVRVTIIAKGKDRA